MEVLETTPPDTCDTFPMAPVAAAMPFTLSPATWLAPVTWVLADLVSVA